MKRTILSAVSCMLVILLMTQPAFALFSTEKSDEQLIEENINALENELRVNGTDVSQELDKMIDLCKSMAAEADTVEESEKINSLVVTLEDLLAEYQLYDLGISTYKYHAIYTPAVAAVIAHFNFNNYFLAAELLTHAKENTVLNSNYTPNFGARAMHAEVSKQIANNTDVSGNASFEPGDRPVDMDLYYAIHSFSYTKSFPTARVYYLRDRYDYAPQDYEYGDLAGFAVDTMYKAQEAGVITPFYTNIKVEVAL